MQETPQHYVQRMLGLIEGKKPLEIMSATPRKVAALIKGVTGKRLGARPQPDKWSVKEILAHLADVEMVQGVRLRMILESSGRPIQGFDQDVWARYSDYAKHDTALSFEAWKVNRERNLRLLKSIPSGMWENYGMHSERGKETVRRVMEMMAGHDVNHFEQIRRILKGKVTPAREARFADAVILLLVFLGCQVVLGLAAGLATGAARGHINSLIVAGIEAGSFAALIPVTRRRLGHWITDYVRYSRVRPGSWGAMFICCAGLIVGLRQLEGLVVRFIPITRFWREAFGQLTGAGAFARGLVVAALVAPLVEEIIFRGIILRGFAANYGRARALLYSSLLFAVVHLNPWQFLPAVVLGLFLGTLYLRTGTVAATWAAHASYNGAILVLSRFPSTRALVDAEVSDGLSAGTLTALTAAGILVFCFGFWLLLRSSRSTWPAEPAAPAPSEPAPSAAAGPSEPAPSAAAEPADPAAPAG